MRRRIRAAVVVVAAGCAHPAAKPGPTVLGGCDSGIEYQGRTLRARADVLKAFRLEGGWEPTALRDVSEQVQIYLDAAAALCDLHARAELPSREYANRRMDLALRFAQLGQLVALPPPAPAAGEAFREALRELAPGAPLEPVTASVQVVLDDGNTLPEGGALRSGQSFRLVVEVSRPSWLYVVLRGPSGLTRLYPASLTGGGLVSGRIAIPSDPGRAFTLDDRRGEERILVFALIERSATLERAIGEVDRVPAPAGSPSIGGIPAALDHLVRYKGVFVTERPARAEGDWVSVAALGPAIAVFRIDHR